VEYIIIVNIVLDQNLSGDVVKRLELDDKLTGLCAGTVIVSQKIHEIIEEFLIEKAANVTKDRKAG